MQENLENMTQEEVLDRYVVAGTEEELKRPEIQSLLIKHGYTDYLLTCVSDNETIITNKQIINQLITTSEYLRKDNILLINGKIEDIKAVPIGEETIELWNRIHYYFKENKTSKQYTIKGFVENEEGIERIEKNLQQDKNNIIAIVKKENNELELQCFMKVYEDINYEIRGKNK